MLMNSCNTKGLKQKVKMIEVKIIDPLLIVIILASIILTYVFYQRSSASTRQRRNSPTELEIPQK
jgi:hypothetical protein